MAFITHEIAPHFTELIFTSRRIIQMMFYAFTLRKTKPVTMFALYVMCTRELTALVKKYKFHPSDALFEVGCQLHFVYRKNSSPSEKNIFPTRFKQFIKILSLYCMYQKKSSARLPSEGK
jgi:hypothetical protein